MKFEDLKDAVCGETILFDEDGKERFFVTILGDSLITVLCASGRGTCNWEEDEIAGWKIKNPKIKPKKLGRLYVNDRLYNAEGFPTLVYSNARISGDIYKPVTIDSEGSVWSVEGE